MTELHNRWVFDSRGTLDSTPPFLISANTTEIMHRTRDEVKNDPVVSRNEKFVEFILPGARKARRSPRGGQEGRKFAGPRSIFALLRSRNGRETGDDREKKKKKKKINWIKRRGKEKRIKNGKC